MKIDENLNSHQTFSNIDNVLRVFLEIFCVLFYEFSSAISVINAVICPQREVPLLRLKMLRGV